MTEATAIIDFFISYNSRDKHWAEWICWQLEDAGYSTVIQAWDFRPGANFVVEMQDALTKASRILAVLSPNYLESSFAFAEWAAAFAHDPRGTARKFVPVRVEGCQPEGLLGQVVYIDLVGRDENSAKKELLDGLKLSRARPSSPPGFPAPDRRVAPEFPIEKPAEGAAGDTYQVQIGDKNRNIVIGRGNTRRERS
jgi:hypothetical protein